MAESTVVTSLLINGQATEHISALDRGFQYGDGLFETLRVRGGQILHWPLHMARLAEGCERLRIPMPDKMVLLAEAQQLCAGRDGVLKITVSRGVTQRGYGFDDGLVPTRVLALAPLPGFPASHASEGVRVRLCQTRLGHNPVLAGIKHLNRLEQVLARAEWDNEQDEIAEGLMLDNQNHVIEGTMSNLFCVQGETLQTPKLDRCGVRGITRGRIMAAARAAGIPVAETRLTVDDLHAARELFLCNTLMGIWPVRQLEDHAFTVGPVTRQLSEALHD